MDNVLYIYRKTSVNMLTEAEHPYFAPVSVVAKYVISDSGFPTSRSGRKPSVASQCHYMHFDAELIRLRIAH